MARLRVVPLPSDDGKYLLLIDRATEDLSDANAPYFKRPDGCAGVLVFECDVEVA